MPLVLNTLKSGLQELFASPPLSESQIVGRWETLWSDYAGTILPTPTSVDISTCIHAFVSALSGLSQSDQAPGVLQNALTAFAAQVAVGQTAGVLVGNPPTTIWHHNFAKQIHAAQAALPLATSIDTWLRSGFVTNSNTGLTTNWN